MIRFLNWSDILWQKLLQLTVLTMKDQCLIFWCRCDLIFSISSEFCQVWMTNVSNMMQILCFTPLIDCNWKVSSYIWAASWQTQKSDCAPSKDSDQPGHPPSLIRVFAVRMKKHWTLSYPLSAQRRLWSDSADAQADLSLRWAHSHLLVLIRGGS